MSTKYPLITVKWADHWVDYGDHDLKDVVDKAKAFTGDFAGHLVFENQRVVILCSNVWEDGTVSDPMYIMKRAIISRSDRDKK